MNSIFGKLSCRSRQSAQLQSGVWKLGAACRVDFLSNERYLRCALESSQGRNFSAFNGSPTQLTQVGVLDLKTHEEQEWMMSYKCVADIISEPQSITYSTRDTKLLLKEISAESLRRVLKWGTLLGTSLAMPPTPLCARYRCS